MTHTGLATGEPQATEAFVCNGPDGFVTNAANTRRVLVVPGAYATEYVMRVAFDCHGAGYQLDEDVYDEFLLGLKRYSGPAYSPLRAAQYLYYTRQVANANPLRYVSWVYSQMEDAMESLRTIVLPALSRLTGNGAIDRAGNLTANYEQLHSLYERLEEDLYSVLALKHMLQSASMDKTAWQRLHAGRRTELHALLLVVERWYQVYLDVDKVLSIIAPEEKRVDV